MKKIIFKTLFVALALSPLSLSACNTFEGAGEDIEVAGENIQNASQDARK